MIEECVIYHVIVVGFHHKKGCQVEYCYPPLKDNETRICDEDLPVEWRHLSSLALPDGAHNTEKDTIFFHLPSVNRNRTIFGVSCYRQILADKLKNKTVDVTRSTVQKSVCVLSSLPLYGLLHAKLELITQAYFNQCDFDKVELLAEMYEYLKTNITSDMLEGQALFGLSVRDLVLEFNHKVLLLFKLIMLEKRVLFYIFPVYRLCTTILSLLSLFPSLIESGLFECVKFTPELDTAWQSIDKCVDVANLHNFSNGFVHSVDDEDGEDSLLKEIEEALNEKYSSSSQSDSTLFSFFDGGEKNKRKSLSFDFSKTQEEPSVAGMKDKWGFPLSVFAEGAVCHPYLSLPFLDSLKSRQLRSIILGATNALFKQKKDLVDVIITIEEDGPRIFIPDPELRKTLSLTTADLRFTDYLIKCVTQTANEFSGTCAWEGGDEWIRLQFRAYLLSLFATVQAKDTSKASDFNELFVRAWLKTNNCRIWRQARHENVDNVPPGHPFSGQLSMADMKLRFSHTMQNSEQGRKLNQAFSQTGKYVSQTGKAVGVAVRSAVSQWWQGLGD